MTASYPPWLKCHASGIQLTLRVKPAGRVNALRLDSHHRLCLELKASPQDGKANASLVVYLARLLGLTQKQVTIGSGHHARDKIIHLRVDALQQEAVMKRLAAALPV